MIQFYHMIFNINWDNHMVFFFSEFCWLIYYYYFLMLNQPFILGLKPIWVLMHYFLIIYFWVWFTKILSRTFVSVFIREIVCSFFVCVFVFLVIFKNIFVWFPCDVNVGLTMNWKVFPPLFFGRECRMILFLSISLMTSPVKAPGLWNFLCR